MGVRVEVYAYYQGFFKVF